VNKTLLALRAGQFHDWGAMDKEIGPLFSEKSPEKDRPFRLPTGERPVPVLDPRNPTGSQPVLATLRTERGRRILSDVRRFILLGAVLVGVGVVLVMFVQAL